MEKSSDKATFSSVMTNSTVMQRIKRLHKNMAGKTKKQTNNPKLKYLSITKYIPSSSMGALLKSVVILLILK